MYYKITKNGTKCTIMLKKKKKLNYELRIKGINLRKADLWLFCCN